MDGLLKTNSIIHFSLISYKTQPEMQNENNWSILNLTRSSE